MSSPPTMTSIPQMDPGRPLKSVNAGFGNEWLMEIQRALTTQFASIGESVVIVSAEELNALKDAAADKTIEERLTSLESSGFNYALPAEALDLADPWWNAGNDVVLYSSYFITTTRAAVSNAPFPWGSSITPGDEQNATLLLAKRSFSDSDDPAIDEVWIQDIVTGQIRHCYRATDRRSAMTNKSWYAMEQTSTSTAEGTSGNAIETSVCGTIAQLCP